MPFLGIALQQRGGDTTSLSPPFRFPKRHGILSNDLPVHIASSMSLTAYRLATIADEAALRHLTTLCIDQLQSAFLSSDQIINSHSFMGLDTRLIEDGTYYVVERDGALAGCGGWSRRETAYGHDTTPGRSNRLLDPATEPARVRAMYTHPDHVRRGVGRLILGLCEAAARQEGFRKLELSSTLAGAPLYRACGFQDAARFLDSGVPLITMQKNL